MILQDEWLQKFLDRLKWLCRHTVPGMAGEPGKKHFGHDAWKVLLKTASGKHKDNSLTIEDLDPLHVYAYLGSDDEKKRAGQVVRCCVQVGARHAE